MPKHNYVQRENSCSKLENLDKTNWGKMSRPILTVGQPWMITTNTRQTKINSYVTNKLNFLISLTLSSYINIYPYCENGKLKTKNVFTYRFFA